MMGSACVSIQPDSNSDFTINTEPNYLSSDMSQSPMSTSSSLNSFSSSSSLNINDNSNNISAFDHHHNNDDDDYILTQNKTDNQETKENKDDDYNLDINNCNNNNIESISKYTVKSIISWFIRTHFNQYSDYLFPKDVSGLIAIFVRDMIVSSHSLNWELNQHQISNLLKLKSKQKLIGPNISIKIRNFKVNFECKFKKYRDTINLYFRLNNNFIPDDIDNTKLKKITFYIEIYSNNDKLSNYFIFKTCSNVQQNGYWSWQCLELNDNFLKTLNLKKLDLFFYLEILKIECHEIDNIFDETFSLNQTNIFRWKLNEKQKNDLFWDKNNNLLLYQNEVRIYSENFNSMNRNWCLKLIKNKEKNTTQIWLSLIKIPAKIKYVDCKCDIFCNDFELNKIPIKIDKNGNKNNNYSYYYKNKNNLVTFDRGYKWIGWNVDNLFSLKDEKIEFYVTIKIINVNGIDCELNDCSKYNIFY